MTMITPFDRFRSSLMNSGYLVLVSRVDQTDEGRPMVPWADGRLPVDRDEVAAVAAAYRAAYPAEADQFDEAWIDRTLAAWAPENPDTVEPGWWWLSFADHHGNLGAAIVQAEVGPLAPKEAWRQGCNPGGQVRIFGPLPADSTELQELAPNTLISPEELRSKGYETTRL